MHSCNNVSEVFFIFVEGMMMGENETRTKCDGKTRVEAQGEPFSLGFECVTEFDRSA